MSDELATRDMEEDEQMNLALEGEKLYIDYTKQPYQYNGKRWMRDNPPEVHRAAAKWIAIGRFSDHAIGRKLNTDYRVVRQLRGLLAENVEEEKQKILRDSFTIMDMTAERAMEIIPDCSDLQKVMVAGGIARDTYMQVSGQPTVHVKIDHHFDMAQGIAELKEMLNKAGEQGREKLAKADVIEATALPEPSET